MRLSSLLFGTVQEKLKSAGWRNAPVELQSALRAKNEILSLVSHEFATR